MLDFTHAPLPQYAQAAAAFALTPLAFKCRKRKRGRFLCRTTIALTRRRTWASMTPNPWTASGVHSRKCDIQPVRCDRDSRWNVDPRRTGAARGAAAQDRRGARDDRGAGEGAPCAREGGARSQDGGARGQDRGDGQEAWWQASAAAARRTAAERSCQSGGRRVAHHAGGGRRVRAVLQRAGGGGGGKPAGGGDGRGSGAQRQVPSRTDVGEDRGIARGIGRG